MSGRAEGRADALYKHKIQSQLLAPRRWFN